MADLNDITYALRPVSKKLDVQNQLTENAFNLLLEKIERQNQLLSAVLQELRQLNYPAPKKSTSKKDAKTEKGRPLYSFFVP